MTRRMKRSQLKLRRETIRALHRVDLTTVGGGYIAITDGNNGCPSEATGCPSKSDWSCWSCPNVQGETT